ncbi:MAG: hypothetical protein ACI83B_003727 [Sediminicola sp.]|jgi:hypothetical protein|tara:strand:+ start:513 stop:842 length:330 start_codon:yes stop_codon:yes gene_type:complete
MWPLKYREYVIRFTINKVNKTQVYLIYAAVCSFIPGIDEYVHIEEMSGRCYMNKKGAATIITMYGCFIPKLHILPKIFQKKYIKPILLTTLIKLSDKLIELVSEKLLLE